jgi:hypothetical protein
MIDQNWRRTIEKSVRSRPSVAPYLHLPLHLEVFLPAVLEEGLILLTLAQRLRLDLLLRARGRQQLVKLRLQNRHCGLLLLDVAAQRRHVVVLVEAEQPADAGGSAAESTAETAATAAVGVVRAEGDATGRKRQCRRRRGAVAPPGAVRLMPRWLASPGVAAAAAAAACEGASAAVYGSLWGCGGTADTARRARSVAERSSSSCRSLGCSAADRAEPGMEPATDPGCEVGHWYDCCGGGSG